MPPSIYFERLLESEDSDEVTAAEESESILDICQTCYENRRLRWHYRSEHEQLISFSNNEFYENDLIVFPSPHSTNSEYGVHHHFIDDSFYIRSRNKKEAQVIVKAIEDHFKRTPQLSLGVATFNIQQRDLINDELERIQKNNPWLEKRIKENETTEEPLFVKNLENVQGDERDIIFISTTYGPDQNSGQVYQRFGPINRAMGWRRLNVIVTRARKRLDIYTSMRSNDIKITANSSLGVIALRKYLEFSETGKIIDLGFETGKEPDSDFEIAVAKLLNTYGYLTSCQVGVAGFFIDIGVHHPEREGEFILGIECDGATYHSDKSIRDRDLLRQRILESKGWSIYRIWSTDWFKNKEKEIKKLITFLGEIVNEDHLKMAKLRSDEILDDSTGLEVKENDIDIPDQIDEDLRLRQELLDFRKKKIEPTVKNLDSSILGNKILEEFVRRKPINKEDFLQFPFYLRNQIDVDQGLFLNEILDIIENYIS